MAIYDISVPLSGKLPVYPGDPPVVIERRARIEEGSSANVSQLQLGTHTGTHIDPPFHFVPAGRKVDELPLEQLIGPAWVADCRGVPEVTGERLARAAIPEAITRLLLLTDNAASWEDPYHQFNRNYVDIAPSGAEWMIERGIEVVGIDYMSVDHIDDDDQPAHRLLLPQGIILIENLDLRHVPPDRTYELICLPLKIAEGDGAPARVVLRDIAR